VTDFVVGLVGNANRVRDAYIRPREVRLGEPGEAPDARATVERLVTLGFETRADRATGQRSGTAQGQREESAEGWR